MKKNKKIKNVTLDSSDCNKIIGENIKSIRTSIGLSQRDIAKPLGITFQQIQKYENGKNRISAVALYTLSLIFKKNINKFFLGIKK